MFTSVVNHFYYPLMKYFEQDRHDELVVAHVIHTLAHMIHCATPVRYINKSRLWGTRYHL